MDKLVKKLPLRARWVEAPLLFVANIPTSHYKVFKTEYYDNMASSMLKQPNLRHFEVLPNVVSNTYSIEERAECLARKVEQISKKHKQRVHVVAHSFAGVDARCAISLNHMDEWC